MVGESEWNDDLHVDGDEQPGPEQVGDRKRSGDGHSETSDQLQCESDERECGEQHDAELERYEQPDLRRDVMTQRKLLRMGC